MKKSIITVSLALIIAAGLTAIPTTSRASNSESKLGGRVLLAVESHGETWYINPSGQKRYFLGDSVDALNLMSNFGLGVSNKDFDSFNNKAPLRLSGAILLKVEDYGKAYYVNPIDLKLHFLGTPEQALNLLQSFSLGITSNDLARLTILENINVSITNSGFTPKIISVSKGATIKWVNYTSSNQTVTSPNNFDFGEIASGKTYSRNFNIVGTYNYYSHDNNSMTGSIIVK